MMQPSNSPQVPSSQQEAGYHLGEIGDEYFTM